MFGVCLSFVFLNCGEANEIIACDHYKVFHSLVSIIKKGLKPLTHKTLTASILIIFQKSNGLNFLGIQDSVFYITIKTIAS
jgi:hypothetical protein